MEDTELSSWDMVEECERKVINADKERT